MTATSVINGYNGKKNALPLQAARILLSNPASILTIQFMFYKHDECLQVGEATFMPSHRVLQAVTPIFCSTTFLVASWPTAQPVRFIFKFPVRVFEQCFYSRNLQPILLFSILRKRAKIVQNGLK